MKIEVNRMEVLSRIENAMVAVMAAPILEQSNAVVFENGELISFNGEILTRQPSPFGMGVTGAIPAADLVQVFKRFPDEVLQVETKEGELIIRGKKRSAGMRMMAEVLLPYKNVPEAGKFGTFSKKLIERIRQASGACGKDETNPRSTHVHVTENMVEATDGFRYFRANFPTGLEREFLIHSAIIGSISKHSLQEISISDEGWIHFKTTGDLKISCICNILDYYGRKIFDDIMKAEGKDIELPENMDDILSRAEIMEPSITATGKADSRVEISLSDNRLVIMSEKENGWFKEQKKVSYSGPAFTFCINPAFLRQMLSKTKKMRVSDHCATMEVEDIQFASALIRNNKPKQETQSAQETEEQAED